MNAPDKQEPLAIVGAACRLAGEASSLGSLWEMISNVKTGHCKIPADRWDADIWHHPDPDRKGGITPRHGYFLRQDVGRFDAPFFSTTAKEAAALDPMKRLLLEVSYESFENAGIPVEDLMNSRTGCYVGCMTNDYELMTLNDIYNIGYTAASATSEAMTANRVSWFFGLKGPSLTLDTACSSSLYALHLACQSLRTGETNMSLVAGVNLIIVPNTMHQLSAMHMLSPEGISHTFDERANGYGRGEGIGALVVKRLSDAIRDGDTIRAVIRGTGVNADGKTPSITQPSSTAQADLINDTYAAAGLEQSETQYFESHGTGTPVGDPIELTAIANTIGAAKAAAGNGRLYVGSIKPSVGHTEGCSGLAGVFKSILLLEQGMLVPTYGVQRINPALKLAEWNIELPSAVIPWPTNGLRRVSVNSFGFGGANAHVILDDAYHYLQIRGLQGRHNTVVSARLLDSDSDSGISTAGSLTPDSEADNNSERKLFVFSAKDKDGIKRVVESFANAFTFQSKSKADSDYVANLAHTLAVRRTHHTFRAAATASSLAELTAQLTKGLGPAINARKQYNNIVMVFTGQGAQWPAMGRELLGHAVFLASVQASQAYLNSFGCQWDAIAELERVEKSKISFPEYSQTLCTVLQVALVDVLRSWKIFPVATIGHSSGEIAAAYAAEYLTHIDAIKLAYVRGISSASVPRSGAMMAAGISASEAEKYLKNVAHEAAVIACVNSPGSVTLSGDVEAIDRLEEIIAADGKFARKLKVNTAYHSPHMRAVQANYLALIGNLEPRDLHLGDESPRPAMYSSLLGKMIRKPEELDAQYWVNNMIQPVQFSAALTALLGHSVPTTGRSRPKPIRIGAFIEVGPHAALQGPVGQIIAAANNKPAKEAPYTAMILRGKDASITSLAVAGRLWACGHNIDLVSVNRSSQGSSDQLKSLSDLPSYPWNHAKSYWHESFVTRANRFPPSARTDLLGQAEDLQNSFEPRWRNHLRIVENPWIEDHKITGTVLYPGAGMLIMAIEGAFRTADSARELKGFRFSNINFDRGLVVPSSDEAAVETRLSLHPHSFKFDTWDFVIYSMSAGQSSWTRHCFGSIGLEYAPQSALDVEDSTLDARWTQERAFYQELINEKTSEEIDVTQLYDHLETIGMQYGPLFRNVVALRAVPSHGSSFGDIVVPDTKSTMPANYEPEHIIHPATMDAIFHIVLAAFNGGRPITQAAVPYSIESMFVAKDQPQGAGALYRGYGRLTSKSASGHEITGDLIVSDEHWAEPKLTVTNFALREVTSSTSEAAGTPKETDAVRKCTRMQWQEVSPSSSELEVQPPSSVTILLPEEPSITLSSFYSGLCDLLNQSGITVTDAQLTPEAMAEIEGRHVIALLEIDAPLIVSWTEEQFNAFKTLVSASKHVLWLTRGGQLQAWSSNMDFAPAQGLLRVMRNEYPISTLPHLDLSTTFDLTNTDSLQLVSDTWRQSLPEDAEMEYAERDGKVYVPRAVDDTGFNHELSLALGKAEPVYAAMDALNDPLRPVQVADGREILWVVDPDVKPELAADEVEINIDYIGLETRSSTVSARQAVGRITRCGTAVQSLALDQCVMVLTDNTMRTHLQQHESLVVGVPEGLAPEAAAVLPSAFVAAQYALDAAHLSQGHTILIHNAASAIGQAALQIAQWRGATAFGLVNSGTERATLENHHGLPASQIFDAALRNFIPRITDFTNGNGIDVVFCTERSSAVIPSLDTLGAFGCFLDLTGGAMLQRLPPSKRNASLLRIDMEDVASKRATIVQDTFKRVFANAATLKPILPTRIYSAAELAQAITEAKYATFGSVAVSLSHQDQVLVPPPPAPRLVLDSGGTYVLAGGLGALGLTIADWMATHGARHIVFLSRSGGSKNEQDLEALRDRGIEADAFKCDVTDARSVARVFESLRAAGRVVRGVVQCAMVLEDTIFDNMSHTQWTRAFAPKYHGSRNLLANLWPQDSPFMILLSSITGIIGNTAQANYASGNTFEDALAHHARTYLGISATSIDVGLVADSSHFTDAGEFGELKDYLGKYGHGWHGLRTSTHELRIAMQAIMRGATADGQEIPAQFVLGLGNDLTIQAGATGYQTDAKFSLRVTKLQETDASGAAKESIALRLAKAADMEEAAAAVEDNIKAVVAHAIGVSIDDVDAQKPLFDYGVDSLKAVEIRNRVLKEMQSEISVFELLSATPLGELSAKIANKSALVKADARVE